MFHVFPVLKMPVHATSYLLIIEQWREWDIFTVALLHTKQEKCFYKPLFLKEKIHNLMQVFPLDTESH